MPSLPPLDSLRFFDAAARHQSFVRAAEELDVTPAAVAHRKGVRLNDHGRAYLDEVRQVLGQLGQCLDPHQRRAQRQRSADGRIAHPDRQPARHVGIAVDEEEDSVPGAGVAGVEATPMEGVPAILDRHEAETVCRIR